jgi:cbb3-type cytochrome oxidase maturation protein
MSVIIILLIVSILIAGGFLIGFLWSVKDGQFDDQQSPAQRMLFDNELKINQTNLKNTK